MEARQVPIPLDDISIEYAEVGEDRRIAITNLLRGIECISVVTHDESAEIITLDWQAGPALSIQLVLSAIVTGSSEFGNVWLNELKSKINSLS